MKISALRDQSGKIREMKAKEKRAKEIYESIAILKLSESFLTSTDFEEKKKTILELQQQLSKADILNRKITELEKDLSFLSNEEHEQLYSKIVEAEQNFNLLFNPVQASNSLPEVLDLHEDLSKELECVICLEVPQANFQVFSCTEHHLLCSVCKNNPTVLSCPLCRQNFQLDPPSRNRLAEKMIRTLK